MSSIAASLPVPVAPPDVVAFAEKQGVGEYLPAVLAMTRRIFPASPIEVFLEEDAEIANDWHIIVEVQVPADSGVEELIATHEVWSKEIFRNCPATHVCIFCLGVSPSL